VFAPAGSAWAGRWRSAVSASAPRPLREAGKVLRASGQQCEHPLRRGRPSGSRVILWAARHLSPALFAGERPGEGVDAACAEPAGAHRNPPCGGAGPQSREVASSFGRRVTSLPRCLRGRGRERGLPQHAPNPPERIVIHPAAGQALRKSRWGWTVRHLSPALFAGERPGEGAAAACVEPAGAHRNPPCGGAGPQEVASSFGRRVTSLPRCLRGRGRERGLLRHTANPPERIRAQPLASTSSGVRRGPPFAAVAGAPSCGWRGSRRERSGDDDHTWGMG
jgi:hypothetical protein